MGGSGWEECCVKETSRTHEHTGEAPSGAKEGHDYVHTRFGLETHSLHLTAKASVKRKPANAGGMVGW